VPCKENFAVKRLTREQSQALTRAKLLDSARIVMAREGYEGASIERIAEEAGFSKGAFYSNFDSKEEIFLELLETHSMQDVSEVAQMLEGIDDIREMIATISNWASTKASDPSWGMLALELFRRARRDATFSDRHADLFRNQWIGVGKILLRMFPENGAPVDPLTLGGIVCELAYGAAASFVRGPSAGDMVNLAITAFYEANGLLGEQQPSGGRRDQEVELAPARKRGSRARRTA
jgi:TetR/AcrR family transcriptional regulator, transcriptional repressor of aconitase